jgi:hypothetical protein
MAALGHSEEKVVVCGQAQVLGDAPDRVVAHASNSGTNIIQVCHSLY